MFEILAIFAVLLAIITFYFRENWMVVTGIFAIEFAVFLILFTTLQNNLETTTEATLNFASGYTGIAIVVTALNIGPLFRLIKHPSTKWLYSQRRNIGVSFWIWVLSHYLSIWSSIFNWDPLVVQSIFNTQSDYAKGIQIGLALFFIFTLNAFISNKKSQKFLRKWWKRLQLLSYPALVLVLLHIILIGKASSQLPILFYLSAFALCFTLLLKLTEVVGLSKLLKV